MSSLENIKLFDIKKFNMKKMKQDCVTVMLAKRDSGKSFLCRDILYHNKDIPSGLIISPTEKANKFYSNFFPDTFIYDNYNPGLLSKLLKRQTRIVKRPGLDPRCVLIMDDCLYDNKWVKDTPIRNIFMNGRHYHMSYLLLMQYPLGIPPALRSNIDYVFLLQENNTSNRKRLYEHYAGMFSTFKMFCETLDVCTKNYGCMVIDNTNRNGKLEDTVFWYKAEPRRGFKFGSHGFWQYHNKKYNPNYELNTNEVYDLNNKKEFVVRKKR